MLPAVSKGLCKNYFRFWRERHRARCLGPRDGVYPLRYSADRGTTQMVRCRPAPEGWGALAHWLRCSLVTEVKAMLLRRASSASQVLSSKIGSSFCTNLKDIASLLAQKQGRRRSPPHEPAPIHEVEKVRVGTARPPPCQVKTARNARVTVDLTAAGRTARRDRTRLCDRGRLEAGPAQGPRGTLPARRCPTAGCCDAVRACS